MKERILDTLDRLIAQANEEGQRAIRFEIAPEGWEELQRQADELGVTLSSDPAGPAPRSYRGVPLDVKELPERRTVLMVQGD